MSDSICKQIYYFQECGLGGGSCLFDLSNNSKKLSMNCLQDGEVVLHQIFYLLPSYFASLEQLTTLELWPNPELLAYSPLQHRIHFIIRNIDYSEGI